MVCLASLQGDYKGDPPGQDDWYMSLMGPSFASILTTTITWAGAATMSLAALSVLGSQSLINAVRRA